MERAGAHRHVDTDIASESCRGGMTALGWDWGDEAGRRASPAVYMVTLRARQKDGPLAQAVQTVEVR